VTTILQVIGAILLLPFTIPLLVIATPIALIYFLGMMLIFN